MWFCSQEMMNIKSRSVEDYRVAFDEVDTDRSGFIELGEVRALLRKVYGKEPPPREVDKFIKFFDRNQDGKVSWDEFTSGFEAVKGTACMQSN
jgi:Ca2+-binding EF-hand superfamily protein